ncbi:MAG: helix-turn-helix domain-containing protein [Erysipelothrix sp.]|nr:helix-turn-helix domain-containing protein [Erysipelothrix sp.]
MGRTPKYTTIQKVQACEDYLNGKHSATEIAKALNMSENGTRFIYEWVNRYRVYGSECFKHQPHNATYTKEFKEAAIQEYLAGKGSIEDIAIKVNIPSPSRLRQWILMYTEGKETKGYHPKPEVYVAERKKTTAEERRQMVDYCLEHNKDYKGTVSTYGVSYSQIFTWVRKYLIEGEDGLKDHRGRRKPLEELSEVEQQKRMIEKLEHKNKELQMELELLKKLEELERRR